MRTRVILAGLVMAGMAACNGEAKRREVSETLTLDKSETVAPASAPAEPARSGVAGFAAVPGNAAAKDAAATVEETAVGRPGAAPISGMIIRTGTAGLEVELLDPGLSEIRRLVARLGGYVANVSMQGGNEQVRQATLELKVPADRFDELTGGLEPLGRVEFVNVAAEDVGEEFVDLTARASNARRLESRLLELLGTRTGRLQDVLSVERELARVREEIERIDGRLRYLKTRAAMSTLSVQLHEPFPIVGDHPGRNVVLEALRQAWRNFVGVLAGSIALLGYAVPVGLLVWGAVGAGRRWRRAPAPSV
ncbi:MAG TPA: DUF4349 domain-containing protein [Gemmatimonadales bacterium]|nr:DUF4349 domain-containing protein [Gemmatimonadales bacterium]